MKIRLACVYIYKHDLSLSLSLCLLFFLLYLRVCFLLKIKSFFSCSYHKREVKMLFKDTTFLIEIRAINCLQLCKNIYSKLTASILER